MRIDAVAIEQQMSAEGRSDLLSRLEAGDMIRAKVMKITASEAVLRLFDGASFTAVLKENIEIQPGQIVELLLKDRFDGQLIMQLLDNDMTAGNNPEEELLKSQLKAMDITVTDKNIKLAEEFSHSGTELTREAFLQAARTISATGLDMAKAVILAANRLTATPGNIKALNQLLAGQFKIDDQLQKLLSLLDTSMNTGIRLSRTAFGGKPDDTMPSNMKAFANSVHHDVITTSQRANSLENISATSISAANEFRTYTPTASTPTASTPTASTPTANTPTASTSGLNIPAAGASGSNTSSATASKADTSGVTASVLSATGAKINIPASVVSVSGASAAAASNANNSAVDESTANPLGAIISRANVSRSDVSVINISVKDNPAVENASEVNSSPLDLSTDAQGAASEKSENLSTQLHSDISRLFADISSESLKDSLDIGNLLRSISQKLDVIRNNAHIFPEAVREQITNLVDNLDNSLRLICEINNYNSYYQIPVRFPGATSTLELYVLKKGGRKRRIDPDNTSVFLSLNTENLGQLDTLINVERKNISVYVRAEDEQTADYVRDFHKELYIMLHDKGYKLVDFKTRRMEDRLSLLNAAPEARKLVYRDRISIDCRL